jgi:hypothetical protein
MTSKTSRSSNPELVRAGRLADELADEFIVVLGKRSDNELDAIRTHAEACYPDSWMPRIVREYQEVWRA